MRDGLPKPTGRVRHRSERYRFGHAERLIMQVELEGWIYGDTPYDLHMGTWWRDARTSDVTTEQAG